MNKPIGDIAEILKLVDDYREALHALAIAESHDFTTTDEEATAAAIAASIDAAVTALYAAGVAEGRRQQAEEVVRQYAVLDSEEYRVALRKMIRTGEIRLPGREDNGGN